MTDGIGELVKVDPVQIVEQDGEEYVYPYRYTSIYVDDIPEDINESITGGRFIFDGDYIWYQYQDEPQVAITEDGVHCMDKDHGKRAKKQAYHALSILDEKGLVGGFRSQ